jgi:uncharacterized protein YkwD
MKKSFGILCLIFMLSACQAPAAPVTATQPPSTPAPATAPATPSPVPTTAVQPPTAAPTDAGPCTDSASFVADVTIPDYSHFDQRETFTKTWRVKNVGTCAWTSDYKAVYSRGDALGAPLSIQLPDTAPGATADVSANMAAPAADGKFEIFYRLENGSGNPMPIDAGDSLWALITVGKYVAYPPATATPGTSASTGSTSSSTGAGLATISCVYGTNADFVSQTLALINAARASNGLPALTSNDKLNTAAQNHSEDMACNSFLSHTGWNGSTPDSRIAAAGYAASIARENIYGQPPQYGGTPQTAMDWWMGDPTHRDAILNPQVKEIGIGYATYARSELVGYFTVDFAAP